MKHYVRSALALLAAVFLLLSGCGKRTDGAGAMGSEVWETMPALTYGEMESEKLQILEWNNGRCEATSNDNIAETEKGFYLSSHGRLYYADKVDLAAWFPVCGKPHCNHTDRMTCNAVVTIGEVVIRDGRIYYQDFNNKYPELVQFKGDGLAIFSRSYNGADRKFEYAMEEAYLLDAGSSSSMLSSDLWVYYVERLGKNGSTTVQLFAADERGTVLLCEKQIEENVSDLSLSRAFDLNGDRYYDCPNIYPDDIFQIEAGEVTLLDRSLIPDNGGYISGSTLRVFRQNDGYYDIDIKTGNEVKLADAQLENSYCQIILPNCIVESTLLTYPSIKTHTEGMTHSMKLFDGRSWRDVALPGELVSAAEGIYVHVIAVTSDSILVQYLEDGVPSGKLGTVLYKIPLDSPKLSLEYVGSILAP